MADFDRAFAVTLKHEGGYANDPNDPGGETYKGIARNRHPSWAGWKKVDKLKKGANFRKALERDGALQRDVRSFYKDQFWDRFRGDDVPDQEVATELFDTGVNMGLRWAVRFLQESINLLNRNNTADDVVVDGFLGNKTLDALRRVISQDKSNEFVMILLNIFQGYRYVEIMRHRPSQEKYARGWLKRTQRIEV